MLVSGRVDAACSIIVPAGSLPQARAQATNTDKPSVQVEVHQLQQLLVEVAAVLMLVVLLRRRRRRRRKSQRKSRMRSDVNKGVHLFCCVVCTMVLSMQIQCASRKFLHQLTTCDSAQGAVCIPAYCVPKARYAYNRKIFIFDTSGFTPATLLDASM